MIRTGILHCPALDAAVGDALRSFLHRESQRQPESAGSKFVFTHESYVAHDRNWLEDVLCRWCDEEELDLILTVGGTLPAAGPSMRELVPEATLAVLDRGLPGLPEAMRAHAGEFSDLALLDRGVAGIRSQTLIINLPGGIGPAVRFLEAIAHLLVPVVAHLHDLPAAPQLFDEMDPAQMDSDQMDSDGMDAAKQVSSMGEESIAPENRSSERAQGGDKLDAEEFAEFLRRRKSSS